jgi:hypothetical protein
VKTLLNLQHLKRTFFDQPEGSRKQDIPTGGFVPEEAPEQAVIKDVLITAIKIKY